MDISGGDERIAVVKQSKMLGDFYFEPPDATQEQKQIMVHIGGK